MNAFTLAPQPAFTARVARNNVRARLGNAGGRAPVRRSSSHNYDPTRPMSMGDRRHLMRLLETYAQDHRGEGGKAPLTASTLQVARTLLFVLMDRTTGRLEHAYTWIAKHSRRAYETACRAVRELEALGVLEVVRRCRRGESPDAPPWVQDCNLYGFRIPAKLSDWWAGRKAAREARKRAYAPEDALVAEEEAERANAAQEAQWHAWQTDLAREERRAEDRRLAGVVQGPGAAAFRARVLGSPS